MTSKITYKSKRGTDKNYPHIDVFIDGIYIGYYMANTSKYASMHENWNFTNKGGNLICFHTKTRKQMKGLLEGSAELTINLPNGWRINKYSADDTDRYFGVHKDCSKCVIYTEYKVVSPTHGYYGAGSKDVKSLAKKLGYDYVEMMSTWMYNNLDLYKEQCDKLNTIPNE